MSATDEQFILQHLDDGVLVVTFNRPQRNNAWTYEMEEQYFEALVGAAANPDVRVIVVTGAGKSFCPGLDMDRLVASAGGQRTTAPSRGPMTLALDIPKPVIAAVNGAAAGIGFIQAMCADLRFASSTAKFTTAFSRRGLPAENALSWLLAHALGQSVALDLLLSARVVLADEAKELGLVNKVCAPEDLMPTVLAYAKDMAANCSPLSLATMKRQVYADLERGREVSRKEALQLVLRNSAFPDFAEGVTSFVEKRPPNFPGLSELVDFERTPTTGAPSQQ